MLNTKIAAIKTIKKELNSKLYDKEALGNYVNILTTSYNMPKLQASDIVSMRTNLEDENDFVLYCVMATVKPKEVENYFTESEISTYSTSKFKSLKTKFPIRIKMIEVKEREEYVGKITWSELLCWRNSSLIRYNEETQRALTRVVNGDTVHYEITVNRSALRDIEDLMRDGKYIATPLVFNMPEDTIFDYDYETMELVITSAEFFDIIDGYHRYLAMSNLYNQDHKFDYTMTIEMKSYSDAQAKQYIWQQDQKTKMKKKDVKSLNQNSIANKVCQQINMDSSFSLANQIGRNDGLINLGDMTDNVDIIFFGGSKYSSRENTLRTIIETKKKIITGINHLIDSDIELIDNKWSFNFITCVMYLIANDKPVEDAKALYDKASSEKVFTNTFTKATVNRLAKCYEN